MAAQPQEIADPPLPPRDDDMRLFAADMLDHLGPDSFDAMPDNPGLLIRPLRPATKYSDNRLAARVLKASPATPFQQRASDWRSSGAKAGYMVNGAAQFAIEGLGKRRVEKGTFFFLPPGNTHRLLDVSPDFEMFEIEMLHLTSLPDQQGSAATEQMVEAETPGSFSSVPGFLGAVQRDLTFLPAVTKGAANAVVVRGNPPHVWGGSPWHIHHSDMFCSLLVKGSAVFDFEGIDRVELHAGDFWFQQPDVRHREVILSMDFEAVGIDLPAVYPTTFLTYDEAESTYKKVKFASATEAAELMTVE